MPLEIERKFLLRDQSWREQAQAGTPFVQGYLVGSKQASVRVRIEGQCAYLNIKSATLGVRRMEYEYPIPLNEARELLDTLCDKPLIEKIRYVVAYGNHKWEIDEFKGDNEGLIVAEVELDSETDEPQLPAWCGQEVSDDPRYYNVSLVKHPYKQW